MPRRSRYRSFNPRPREAGDRWGQGVGKWGPVSIHARAKRATPRRCLQRLYDLVSIHARAKRATRVLQQSKRQGRCFNPRPREAGDVHNSPHSP